MLIFLFSLIYLDFQKKLKLIKSENKKTVRRFKTSKERLNKSSLTKNNPDYDFPSIELLELPEKIEGIDLENKKNAEINTNLLANVLNDFKISGEITDVKQGPIVTLFELTPAPGTSFIKCNKTSRRCSKINECNFYKNINYSWTRCSWN